MTAPDMELTSRVPDTGGAPSGRPGRARTARGRTMLIGLGILNRMAPKQTRKVVLHSIPLLEDGIRSVLDALQCTQYRAVVLVDGGVPAQTTLARATFVTKRSLRGLWHYLTARHVFTTHGLFGGLRAPRNQHVVNLWHGEPPVKPIGRYENESPQFATLAPVTSVLGRAYRCAEFGLHPRNVPVLGAPRNDQMLRTDRSTARARLLGEAHSGPAFIWMPTFREIPKGRYRRVDASSYLPGVPFTEKDLASLDDWLIAHDARVSIKLHPLAADEMPGGFRAIDVLTDRDLSAVGLSVYRGLPAFDGLITDASSIWIDYLLLDKPVMIAFPDIAEYRAVRGLNMEPYEDWVPGPFVKEMAQLVAVLDRWVVGEDDWASRRRRTARLLHQHRDADSTDRILQYLGIVDR